MCLAIQPLCALKKWAILQTPIVPKAFVVQDCRLVRPFSHGVDADQHFQGGYPHSLILSTSRFVLRQRLCAFMRIDLRAYTFKKETFSKTIDCLMVENFMKMSKMFKTTLKNSISECVHVVVAVANSRLSGSIDHLHENE